MSVVARLLRRLLVEVVLLFVVSISISNFTKLYKIISQIKIQFYTYNYFHTSSSSPNNVGLYSHRYIGFDLRKIVNS